MAFICICWDVFRLTQSGQCTSAFMSAAFLVDLLFCIERTTATTAAAATATTAATATATSMSDAFLVYLLLCSYLWLLWGVIEPYRLQTQKQKSMKNENAVIMANRQSSIVIVVVAVAAVAVVVLAVVATVAATSLPSILFFKLVGENPPG